MDWASGEKPTATKLNNILQSRCHVYQTTPQTLTTAVSAAVTFDAEAYDPKGFHSTSVNTARVTPIVAGTYKVFGQCAYATNTTGDRGAHVKKNGTGIDSLAYGGAPAMNGTALLAGIAHCSGTVSMNGTTDYLELYATQNSGGNLNTFYVGAGLTTSYLIVERIGD